MSSEMLQMREDVQKLRRLQVPPACLSTLASVSRSRDAESAINVFSMGLITTLLQPFRRLESGLPRHPNECLGGALGSQNGCVQFVPACVRWTRFFLLSGSMVTDGMKLQPLPAVPHVS